MKFILKLLLAPLMLVLWIVEWALTLALKASAVVCVIASALFLLSGVFYFVDGNVQNGCICLGIAFLLSPYGLHYLAVKLTARFIGMRMQYRLTQRTCFCTKERKRTEEKLLFPNGIRNFNNLF